MEIVNLKVGLIDICILVHFIFLFIKNKKKLLRQYYELQIK